jgi:uncharacterized protein (DUF4415 family)
MTTKDDKRRAAYHQMAEGLRRLEMALHGPRRGKDAVPDAWHEIAQGPGPGRKVKVTLWVEADVLRFFRSLGAGHTTKMAEVLATFMHARLAGVVKGPEDVDYSTRILTPEEEAAKATREARWDALEDKLEGILQRRRDRMAGRE